MPADRTAVLHVGRRGLNLRDEPSSLHPEELADGINWQIGVRGSLEQRLGYSDFGGFPAPALEFEVFSMANGTRHLIAYCTDGHVYHSSDGVSWASIATGLSTTARPSFAQYLDRIYWSNGIDRLRYWDGVNPVVVVSTAPFGELLEVWRDKLWIGNRGLRQVSWSKLGDPTDWTNTFNTIRFPSLSYLESMKAAPNPGAGADASDGILVGSRTETRRIVDDSDNSAGIILGGANVLVDGGQGFVSNRSLASVGGRLYGLGPNGVYSTDGHNPLRLESAMLGQLFNRFLSMGQAQNFCGLAAFGRYYLAVEPVIHGYNSRLLELYLQHEQNGEGQHPWMAHDVSVAAMVNFQEADVDRVIFCDGSPGDEDRLRRLFDTGTDTEGDSTDVAITSIARSGAYDFGLEQPKRVRRVIVNGEGNISVGVSADFETFAGEARTFLLGGGTDVWGDENWNEGTWGPAASAGGQPAYFTKTGRFLTLQAIATSSAPAAGRDVLKLGAVPIGGSSIAAVYVTHAPLDWL